MINVQDAAHKLADAIKKSEEFTKYKALDEKIVANKDLKEKIDKFQGMQMELQRAHLGGAQLTEDDLKASQELFNEINQEPLAQEYFQAELRVSQMMSDVSKILGDAMDFRGVNKES